MADVITLMPSRKRIALIAHDNCKAEMLEWAEFNRETLATHELHATGTTGALLADELGLTVHRFLSGPLGGDQQVGAAIAEGRIDFLVFFWDPLEPQPHDVDVKALLRIAVVCNVPTACNRADRRLRALQPADPRGIPEAVQHLRRADRLGAGRRRPAIRQRSGGARLQTPLAAARSLRQSESRSETRSDRSHPALAAQPWRPPRAPSCSSPSPPEC